MSDIVTTTRNYETSTNNLTGGAWTLGGNVYIDRAALILTNNSSRAFTNADLGTNGIIGVLEEVPDVTVANDRIVVRLTATAVQNTAIKKLIQSTDL